MVAQPQQTAPGTESAFEALVVDPSFEVLPPLECGSALGILVSESADARLFVDVEPEEREIEPELEGQSADGERARMPEEWNSSQLVENKMRWTLQRTSVGGGVQPGEVDENRFEFETSYKIRGAVAVGNGELLVLGDTGPRSSFEAFRTTYIEYWVVDVPFGPGLSDDLWLPMRLSEEYQKPTTSMEYIAKPGHIFDVPCELVTVDAAPGRQSASELPGTMGKLPLYRKRAFLGSLRRAPVAMDVHTPGPFVFVLTRRRNHKATTLIKLEPGEDWRETIVTSSRQHPMLAASTQVEVFPVGGSTGYLLAVWGTGFGRTVNGQTETHFVRNVLCLEDLNGDGEFEAEQLFPNRSAFNRYHAQFFSD